MKIYRVINKDGKGFYQSNNGCPPVEYWYPMYMMCDDEMSTKLIENKHPRINKPIIDEKYHFAFTSIHDLIDWFPLDILQYMNGSIIEIEIDKEFVEVYPKQCIFDCHKVISTKTIDKTQFYKHISYPTDEWWIWK